MGGGDDINGSLQLGQLHLSRTIQYSDTPLPRPLGSLALLPNQMTYPQAIARIWQLMAALTTAC
jgi:hypothetical protein